MRILFFLILSMLISTALKAQQITISGKAIDEYTEMPVEAATIYLSLQKDSTLIDYSLTNADGEFKLELKKIDEPVFFKVSDDLSGEFNQDFPNLIENKDLGTIKLSPIVSLEGVVIKSTPPIQVKNDTLEFNAASFKVRPDANVETLLRQLPGVDIDEDGKITVNGKEVNQILVNGKPFFDKDGKIALQNLPAEIINKVQVTDTKTKKEELANEKASSNNASINLTIDEEKNKGIMLKALAGLGSEDRYESSLMLNYFKGDSRFSVLGSSNNINSVGFSMNEIFDNMGGGRNNSVYSNSSTGSFGINGMNFGGGNGITQSYLGGINYTDEFGKDIDFSSNYFYTQTDTENRNKSRTENLLPNGTVITNSINDTKNQSFNHNLNASFEVKIDSTSTLWIEPKYAYNKVKSSSIFEKISQNELDEILNENQGNSFSDDLTQTFSNQLSYFKSFGNKSQLSIDFSNNNKSKKSDQTNISNTYFYQTDEADDIRNQFSKIKAKEDDYQWELSYNYPIFDSIKMGIGAEYSIQQKEDIRATWDFDPITERYQIINDLQTSTVSSDFQNLETYVSFRLQKKKFYFNLSGGIQFLNQSNTGQYLGNNYDLDLDEIAPSISFNSNYRYSKNASIYVNYNNTVKFAGANQLLAIEDLSNPLFTRIGNPNLKPIREHSIYAGWNNFNFQSKTGFNAYMGATFEETSVVDYRIVDENFKTTATYENVNGNYMLWAGLNLNKSFNKGIHKFRLGGGLSVNHYFNQGFIDGLLYESNSFNLRPRVNFSWDVGKSLSIKPSYNLSFQFTNYENYRIDKTDNVQHNFKIETTNYWPKNFVFGNDFSYTYNSNITDGFKKDFFLWNSSLAYNFWKDQLTFKVKVYDILGQNTGTRRNIGATYISDVENDVLKRYVMFSLGFKLDQFGGKKKSGRRFMTFD